MCRDSYAFWRGRFAWARSLQVPNSHCGGQQVIYDAEVTLQSPVTLTLRRATGNDVETLDYIPGTVLRGALAAAYLETGAVDLPFRSLFLEGRVRFGSLRVDGADVWPLSARVWADW